MTRKDKYTDFRVTKNPVGGVVDINCVPIECHVSLNKLWHDMYSKFFKSVEHRIKQDRAYNTRSNIFIWEVLMIIYTAVNITHIWTIFKSNLDPIIREKMCWRETHYLGLI